MTAPTERRPPSCTVKVMLPRPAKPEFKQLGGSDSDHFNQLLADQTLNTLWVARADEEQRDRQYLAATAAMIGAKPQNELEGMLIGQMIACHSAAMECHRRAMLAEQTIEARQANLNAASRMSRTYAALLEGLSRHRGKGQQVVRVEHVTVQAGGQAIVGAVTQGGGDPNGNEDRPHAPRSITHESEPEMRCADPLRQPVPLAGGDGPATVSDARRRHRQRSTGR
jgi:hypothetical protein